MLELQLHNINPRRLVINKRKLMDYFFSSTLLDIWYLYTYINKKGSSMHKSNLKLVVLRNRTIYNRKSGQMQNQKSSPIV